MKFEIGVKEIPIFKYLDEQEKVLLSRVFYAKEMVRNHVILSYGSEVPGLYIVGAGEVSVFTDNNDALLAKMTRGDSFGEMSLIEDGQKSSANIIVTSANATLIFCPRQAFKDLLRQQKQISLSFYQGAAELLSHRLRVANEQIGTQISCAHQLLSDLLSASNVTNHLGKTRSEVIHTGENMAGQLFELIPRLTQLSEKHPQCQSELLEIQTAIENLLVVETQNFDKISQQIDLIKQYFANIKRVIRGDKPKDIKGDTLLFDK